MDDNEIRKKIADEVRAFGDRKFSERVFIAGESVIPPSGKVIAGEEMAYMVDAVMDGWLTTGRFNERFQSELGDLVGVKNVLTTVSGSAANLLALTALTSERFGARALRAGDEVITVAAGFPTTVNPIVQNNLVPVFVDVQLPTYNIDVSMLEEALSPKTKAIMIAHTLGNPFDLDTVCEFARQHNLWLVEDCCDALGTMYRDQPVGTFGDVATLSFYPAHHITMGEGGAVLTKSSRLKKVVESFRDWGRDCYCPPGDENTCGNRFDWQLGDLPAGYDHKYIYSHCGYNLKITDMQAACGLAQLKRLSGFNEARRLNFDLLTTRVSEFEDFLILPEATEGADPSWFGYPLTLRDSDKYSRVDLLRFLDSRKIGSRLIFAGNITRQPYFLTIPHRVVGGLQNTDTVMNHSFWLGTFPGLGPDQYDYIAASLKDFFHHSKR